jgi:hypothetical protein
MPVSTRLDKRRTNLTFTVTEIFWQLFRQHQRLLRQLGVKPCDDGINDTPVKAAHMVDGYCECQDYGDIQKVDKQILGLGPDEVLEDLVELHANYKRQQKPGWEEVTGPLLAMGVLGGPEKRMKLKRTYYEEWFDWKKANMVRYAKVQGDEVTVYSISVSDAFPQKLRDELEALVSKMSAFASSAIQTARTCATDPVSEQSTSIADISVVQG